MDKFDGRGDEGSNANLQSRLQELVERLIEIEAEIEHLSDGQIDAIVSPTSGPILLRQARQSLQVSEQRFRALFDSALDSMIVADDDGFYVDVNPAACELFGLPHDELIGKRAADFSSQKDKTEDEWRAFRQGGQIRGEFVVHRPDGSQRIAEFSATPNMIPGRHLSILRDVTARKQAEAQLLLLNRQLEQRNRHLLVLHTIGLKLEATLNLDEIYRTIYEAIVQEFFAASSVQIVLWDEAHDHLVCDFAVLQGKTLDVKEFFASSFNETPLFNVSLMRQPRVLNAQELGLYFANNPLSRSWSGPLPRALLVAPLVSNDRIIGLAIVLHQDVNAFAEVDLTLVEVLASQMAAAITKAQLFRQKQDEIAERQRAEEAVRASERRFRALIERSTDGIALVDEYTTVGYASPSTERVLGYRADEILHVNGYELVHPDDVAMIGKGIAHALKSDASVALGEPRVRHKDGSWRWIEAWVSNLIDEPSVNALVVNYRDVTERKRTEDIIRLTHDQDQQFVEGLTTLVVVGNQLSQAASFDELCRMAVELGQSHLGFERLGIWFASKDRKTIHGSYGVDKDGAVRDERDAQQPVDTHDYVMEILSGSKSLIRRENIPLLGEQNQEEGFGTMGVAAMGNAQEVIGYISMDNLLTQTPVSEAKWHVLSLFASMVGHLCSLKQTEGALRKNQALLEKVLETLPVGVWIINETGHSVELNQAARKILEIPSDLDANVVLDIPGWWVKTGKQVQPDEWPRARAFQHGETMLNREIEIETWQHARRVILNSAIPILDERKEGAKEESNQVIGAIMVFQDITQQNRHAQEMAAIVAMAEALRKLSTRESVLFTAVERVKELMAGLGALITQRHKESGEFQVEASVGGFCAATQADVAQLTGLYHGDLSGGQPFILNELSHISIDLLQGAKTLAIMPLVAQEEVTGMLMVACRRPFEDERVGLLQALVDIIASAVHRATLYEEVQAKAQQLQGIMDTAPIGLFLLDRQSRIVLANRLAETKLALMSNARIGDTLEHLAGHSMNEFLKPADDQRVLPTEIVLESPVRRILGVLANPLYLGPAEFGWVVMVQDLTVEREIQERIQHHDRLAAIGQMAAGIAHDFNNLIAVIVLYVQMLQRNSSLSAADMKRLGVIREQALQASHLVRQILDFSRQSVMERQKVDLVSLLQELMALWSHTLPENIRITLRQADEGDYMVHGDATRLQQVFMNLAVNARDAMPQGGELRLHLRRLMVTTSAAPLPEMEPGAWVAVEMSDTGIGIAPENLAHIFDPFFTTKSPGKGTGLGLAQVYGIVRQHEGTIEVQSQLGQGTTFVIYLPNASLLVGSLYEEENEGSNLLIGNNQTILLVEDYAPAREAARSILEACAFRVIEAENGQEGIALFRQHQDEITLVLSDLVMPEMGGMELYRLLREANTQVKMVIMTGYPLEDGGRELLEEGIVAWVQKPFTIEKLTEKVSRTLRK